MQVEIVDESNLSETLDGDLVAKKFEQASVDFIRFFIDEMNDISRVSGLLRKIEEMIADPAFLKGLNSEEVIALHETIANRRNHTMKFLSKLYAEGSKNKLLAKFLDLEKNKEKPVNHKNPERLSSTKRNAILEILASSED